MKFRSLVLIGLGLVSLITMHAMPIGHNDIPKQIEISDIPPNMTEIDIMGCLDFGSNPNSVEAYYNQNMVVVCFHQNFGYVHLILIGEMGNTVYNNTVNTAIQQTFYIPIAGVPDGRYTLILDSVNGHAEGDFEK